MQHFPFDTQVCAIKIGPWTHTKSEIDIKNRVPLDDPLDGEVVFDAGTYYESSEWEMVSASARINEMKYRGV